MGKTFSEAQMQEMSGALDLLIETPNSLLTINLTKPERQGIQSVADTRLPYLQKAFNTLIPTYPSLLLYPLRRNFKVLRLLKIGDFTRGRLFAKNPTGQVVRMGAKVMPVYRFQFRFEHNGTVYHATCRTHHPALVEDEDSESILFDRFKPSFNLVYDAVPNLPKITAAGRLAPMGWERAWMLFLPAFTVAVNLTYLISS
jgi:hypothetical protein